MRSKGITASLINQCIRQILNAKKQRINEVPYVTAIVQLLPIILNHPIFSLLKDGDEQYHLKFTGCLIHGRPIASFMTSLGNRGCELGDILLVCHDINTNVNQAMLLQAKVSDKKMQTLKLVGNSSLNQLELYTKWPEFSLRGNGDKTYTIGLSTISDGANYAILRHWSCPNVTVTKPSSNLKIGAPSFGACLVNFLKFRRGKSFVHLLDGNDDKSWSGLISDLLSYVATHNSIHCRELSKGDIPRIRTADVVSWFKASTPGEMASLIISEMERLRDEIVVSNAEIDENDFGVIFAERAKVGGDVKEREG